MREFRQKKDFNKKLFSPVSLVILSIIAVIILISTFKIYIKGRNVQLKNERMAQEIADLEKRKAVLEEETAKIGTENGLEEEIREKFSVKKPGEEVITIMDKKPEDGKINAGEGRGFFAKIWWFIKGVF